MSKERKNCLCTAMLYDPAEQKSQPEQVAEKKGPTILSEKWQKARARALQIFKPKAEKLLALFF